MELRIFTDANMFFISVVALVCFIVISIILFRDDDTNWVWYLVRVMSQSLLVMGFYLVWQNPGISSETAPIAELTRPGLVGLWLAGILEAFVNIFNARRGL